MSYDELKSKAKAQIKGKIGILFVITLVISVITCVAQTVLSLIPIAGNIIAALVITPAFTLSLVRIYLMVIRGEDPQVSDSFSGFDDFWSACKVTFFVSLFTYLWSLLFIIPGIVKAYSYSMSMYILAENKEKPALQCIRESMDMTNGHKMDLFFLDLSFFGWAILVTITFGIAGIWVSPYYMATWANAYESLKPATLHPVTVFENPDPVVEESPETVDETLTETLETTPEQAE